MRTTWNGALPSASFGLTTTERAGAFGDVALEVAAAHAALHVAQHTERAGIHPADAREPPPEAVQGDAGQLAPVAAG